MVRYLILSLLSFVAVTATAQTRAIMETIPATRKTIVVDTTNARVDIASDTYRGPIAEVSLFVATNAVVGVGSKPVVIYGTGTVSAQKLNLPVASQCAQFDANGYLTGSGTTCANAATDFGPSTGTLSIRLDAVAVSTTALSASTVTIKANQVTDEAVISTLGASTNTLRNNLTSDEATISTLGASTNTIRSNLTSDESVISALGVSTGSLATTKLSSPTVSGIVGNVLTLGASGQPSWATASSGSGGSLISTGTLGVGATSYMLRNQLKFDAGLFAATDDIVGNATFLTLSTTVAGANATLTVFKSASNFHYTPPANASQLVIDFWGQGGGGGANATNAGTAGSSTTWVTIGSTIAANGGGGGPAGSAGVSIAGGLGGTNGTGGDGVWASSSVVRSAGNGGGSTMSASDSYGSFGGGSCRGGGAAGTASSSQQNGAAFTGGGGSGGGNSTTTGGGAGGAECVELVINAPFAPSGYYITVGSLGGQGGAAGTVAGGTGGTGGMVIHEIYPPAVVLPSTFSFAGNVSATDSSTFTFSPKAVSSIGLVFVSSMDFTSATATPSLSIPSGVQVSSCDITIDFDLGPTSFQSYVSASFNNKSGSAKFTKDTTAIFGGAGYGSVTSNPGFTTGLTGSSFVITGGGIKGKIELSTIVGSSVIYSGATTYRGEISACSGSFCPGAGGFQYNDTTPLSSVQFNNSQSQDGSAPDAAHTFSMGHIEIWKKGQCHK